MANDLFDYNGFSIYLTEQAQSLVPPNFEGWEKEYLLRTIRDLTFISGEAICKDTTLKFTQSDALFVVQLIAEWGFHKTVDLVLTGVPDQYWDTILQRVAYIAYEGAVQGLEQKYPEDKIILTVEHYVDVDFKSEINKLFEYGAINEETKIAAENHSNFKEMASAKRRNLFVKQILNQITQKHADTQEKNEETKLKTTPKFDFTFLAFCILIYLFFSPKIAITKHFSMQIPNLKTCVILACFAIAYFYLKYFINKFSQHNDSKQEQDNINDIITITYGKALESMFKPGADGRFFAYVAILRIKLCEENQYTLPMINVELSPELAENEYEIFINNKSCFKNSANLTLEDDEQAKNIVEKLKNTITENLETEKVQYFSLKFMNL